MSGSTGLQKAFGAAGISALANLTEISQTIQDAVRPPPEDNTTSDVLTGVSYLLKLGAAAPPPASQVAEGLSASFAIAGYFTHKDQSANLIGPEVTTAASKLGVELTDRYRTAGNNLDSVGQVLVSDYGKLIATSARVNRHPGPGEVDWRIGSIGNAQDTLIRAARQTIYTRLFPLAYPVMYDLGGVRNAREWHCNGPFINKKLFADQADGAQFIARFPRTGWNPRIAVAQVHAQGSKGSARIHGPPGPITDSLFKDPSAGGLGLQKLDFFSPRNGFRYLPGEPAKDAGHKDGAHNWNTLSPFPTAPAGGMACSRMPDPPNNSG
jgi:hypothetical protein